MDRRTCLATAGATFAALAGCLDAGSADGGGSETATQTGESGTSTPGTGTEAGTGTETGTETGTGTETRTGTPDLDPVHESYETTTVRVETPDGESLGTVTAAIADTGDLRYTGLSDTDSLPADRGMLFVFGSVADRTFVMRRMDFGIDIVYADSTGTITGIHHAPAPGPDEDGTDQRYPGRGRYVLEVNYEWTTERGVDVGDRLAFDLDG